jgi:hypothetical protein
VFPNLHLSVLFVGASLGILFLCTIAGPLGLFLAIGILLPPWVFIVLVILGVRLLTAILVSQGRISHNIEKTICLGLYDLLAAVWLLSIVTILFLSDEGISIGILQREMKFWMGK